MVSSGRILARLSSRLPLSLTPLALPRSSTQGSPSISLNAACRRDTFLSSTRISALSSRPMTTPAAVIGTSRTSPFGARTMMKIRRDGLAATSPVHSERVPPPELLLEDLHVDLVTAIDQLLHELR